MLKDFHDTWYAPNNAILVIAGDVDPQATLSRGQAACSATSAAKKLPRKPPVRLRPVQPTTFTVDTDRPSGTLMIAVRTPGPRDADFPALEVLADVLEQPPLRALRARAPGQGRWPPSSRSTRCREAGLAYAALSFTAGRDPKALETDVRAILARVAREGVPAELVAAAKLQERSAAQFQRNSIPSWPRSGRMPSRSTGSPLRTRTWRASSASRSADVNRVARKYLDLGSRRSPAS